MIFKLRKTVKKLTGNTKGYRGQFVNINIVQVAVSTLITYAIVRAI